MNNTDKSAITTRTAGDAQRHDCYISCDTDANSRVSSVCREIRAMGGNFRHDSGKLSGDEWARQTTDTINACHAYVLFVTKGLLARENRFIRNEFFFAKKSGVSMYAVMLNKISPEDIDVSLKKWFSEIGDLCKVIVPPTDSSPEAIARLMNDVIGFAPRTSEAGQKPDHTPESEKESATSRPKSKKADSKTSKESSKQAASDQKKGKTAIIIGAVAAAVAVLAILGFFVLPDLFIRNKPENFTYDILGKGVVITSLTDDELTSVRIPEKIEGKQVIKIGEAAFSGCANLKKVRIPDSVKEIDSSAFLFCEKLNDVRIPGSAAKIGESAFSDCTSLSSVTLPEGVMHIGPSAFQGCTALRTVRISDSVKTIEESAFMNCTSLKKVTLPDSVTALQGSAFEGCTALSEVRLSENIPEICFSTFEGCTELKEIVVTKSVREIGDYAFSGCTSLKKAVIPASVDNIVESAFSDCPDLTIYGKAGSCAEEYAQGHDIPFVAQ